MKISSNFLGRVLTRGLPYVIISIRSVVTRDVPAFTIVGGNPARVIKNLVVPKQ